MYCYLIAVHLGAGAGVSSLPAPDPANCVKWSGRKYYRLSENIIEILAPAPLSPSPVVAHAWNISTANTPAWVI